jgi:hypothetical protein
MTIDPEPSLPPAGRKSAFDWADGLVPAVAGMAFAAKEGNPDPTLIVGHGLGFALGAAFLFCGVRQVIRAINLRRPLPKPREPLRAAIVGIAFWMLIIFWR